MWVAGISIVLHLLSIPCPPLVMHPPELLLNLSLKRLQSLLFGNSVQITLLSSECLVLLNKQVSNGTGVFIKPVLVGAFLFTKKFSRSLTPYPWTSSLSELDLQLIVYWQTASHQVWIVTYAGRKDSRVWILKAVQISFVCFKWHWAMCTLKVAWKSFWSVQHSAPHVALVMRTSLMSHWQIMT